jgi:1-acyl-sn-glycerol-3-phosphate acyltransferase
MQLFRSLLFNLIMWASVLVYGPLAVLSFPLPYLARYRFICGWARIQMWLLRVLCGLRYRVSGAQHLPNGAAVFLAKHQSTWETFAFQQIFPPYAYVLKRELMWIPLFGWGLALLKPIAIDRGAGRQAIQQVISQGRARLQDGISVMIYPEGTRMPPGQTRRWGMGGAVLAAETGYPCVPVAHNAGSYWPRRGFLKRPGIVDIVIGPPIETRGKSAEEINREAEAWVARTMQQLESGGIRAQPATPERV